MTNANFRYIEKCLYNYRYNKAQLARKREILSDIERNGDIHVQSYTTDASHNGPGNPVLNHVIRIDELERDILNLERCVAPIDRLVQDLNAPSVTESSPYWDLWRILELLPSYI